MIDSLEHFLPQRIHLKHFSRFKKRNTVLKLIDFFFFQFDLLRKVFVMPTIMLMCIFKYNFIVGDAIDESEGIESDIIGWIACLSFNFISFMLWGKSTHAVFIIFE